MNLNLIRLLNANSFYKSSLSAQMHRKAIDIDFPVSGLEPFWVCVGKISSFLAKKYLRNIFHRKIVLLRIFAGLASSQICRSFESDYLRQEGESRSVEELTR